MNDVYFALTYSNRVLLSDKCKTLALSRANSILTSLGTDVNLHQDAIAISNSVVTRYYDMYGRRVNSYTLKPELFGDTGKQLILANPALFIKQAFIEYPLDRFRRKKYCYIAECDGHTRYPCEIMLKDENDSVLLIKLVPILELTILDTFIAGNFASRELDNIVVFTESCILRSSNSLKSRLDARRKGNLKYKRINLRQALKGGVC